MSNIARLVGSAIAMAGTLSQLAVIAATIPRWSECADGLCVISDPGFRVEINVWRPFIDNGDEGAGRAEREPQCPAPRGRSGRYGLAAAPLPEGFDPHAYGRRPLYACVLAARDGTVRAARMLRGTGEPARDLDLVGTIRANWRFEADEEGGRLYAWQRVKLSPGAAGGMVNQPPTVE